MKNYLQKLWISKCKSMVLILLLLFATNSYAVSPIEEQVSSPGDSTIWSNPMFLTLVSVILFLAIIIFVLAGVMENVGSLYKKKDNSGKLKTIITIAVVTSSVTSASAASGSYGGITPPTFYFLISIIIFEIIIIGSLINLIYFLLRKEEIKKELQINVPEKASLLEKINASVAVEKEEEIMFDHEYDGIRELDNNLPPWWKYGFYITIFVGVIYLAHYHIAKTGSLQIQEYTDELNQAEIQMAAYRKKAANLVDETNVSLLTDPAEIEKGKVFFENCYACHGKLGEGGVGPNLTDDFWLYGGDIKNIFKIIKYGTEKGMKSWKEEFSPVQMSQLASYVKSLRGTNPPNAKEAEGVLYKEDIHLSAPDSVLPVTDSTALTIAK